MRNVYWILTNVILTSKPDTVKKHYETPVFLSFPLSMKQGNAGMVTPLNSIKTESCLCLMLELLHTMVSSLPLHQITYLIILFQNLTLTQ